MSTLVVAGVRHWPSCPGGDCSGCRPAEGAIGEVPIMRQYAPTRGVHWPSCSGRGCDGCRRAPEPDPIVRRRPTTRAERRAVAEAQPLGYGICRACKKSVKRRRDGTLRPHGYEIRTAATRLPRCEGSGEQPAEGAR